MTTDSVRAKALLLREAIAPAHDPRECQHCMTQLEFSTDTKWREAVNTNGRGALRLNRFDKSIDYS